MLSAARVVSGVVSGVGFSALDPHHLVIDPLRAIGSLVSSDTLVPLASFSGYQ